MQYKDYLLKEIKDPKDAKIISAYNIFVNDLMRERGRGFYNARSKVQLVELFERSTGKKYPEKYLYQ